MDWIKNALQEICKDTAENFPLSYITSLKTGGPARFFVSPYNTEEIKKILDVCRRYNLPLLVVGKGTNLLISDKGFDGVVISTKNLNKIQAENNTIYCQAGVLLSAVLKTCIVKSLKGLEFLSGIPGTAGGAVISNAGLKKEWISEKIVSVDVISLVDIKELTLPKEDITFGYRTCRLEGYFIAGVLFRPEKGKREKIKMAIADYMKKRIKTQPLEYPSAGSVFKNPPGLFAGMLIEKCGLKGYSIGGASISDKHANFIINKGNATSEDIYKIICKVKEEVKRVYNIKLETEIKIIGSFGGEKNEDSGTLWWR